MSALTREGVTVRAGQVWKDLDKRFPRTCIVTGVIVTHGIAVALMTRNDRAPGARAVNTRVRIDRMHKSATGWALVSEPTS